MHDTITAIVNKVQQYNDVIIDLNPFSIRYISNEQNDKALDFFNVHSIEQYKEQPFMFKIFCINTCKIDRQTLKKIHDSCQQTYRAKSFAKGYYATDHFGQPVHLHHHLNSFFIFGDSLEKVIWPYLIKYLLFSYSITHNKIFLKAAAFEINNKSTLVIGRGEAGKTFLLNHCCSKGAHYISNSHVIIDQNNIIEGIKSNIRIRDELIHSNHFQGCQYTDSLLPNEFLIDPNIVYHNIKLRSSNLSNIIFLDGYDPQGGFNATFLSSYDAYSFLEQFALGLNVYRLEEDLLDMYHGDLKKFLSIYNTMKKHLQNIIQHDSIRCYHLKTDLKVESNSDKLIRLLTA